MARSQRAASEWIGHIDAAAERTNVNLSRLMDLWDEHVQARLDGQNHPDLLMAIGINITLQLAYQNTVAAANFYMVNTLWITPDA